MQLYYMQIGTISEKNVILKSQIPLCGIRLFCILCFLNTGYLWTIWTILNIKLTQNLRKLFKATVKAGRLASCTK